jgi:hypothetical protein
MRRLNPPTTDPPEFFTDRALGIRVVTALRGEGWNVHAMKELFPSSDRTNRERFWDENWIRTVTARRLVILSKDGFRWSHERAVIVETGARVFSIPNASLRAEHMAERFFASRDEIFGHCQRDGPFMYSVHPTSLQPVTLPEPDGQG